MSLISGDEEIEQTKPYNEMRINKVVKLKSSKTKSEHPLKKFKINANSLEKCLPQNKRQYLGICIQIFSTTYAPFCSGPVRHL